MQCSVVSSACRLAGTRAYSVSTQQQTLLNEPCILVDNRDRVIGEATKQDCHQWSPIGRGDMLHRAFSVFLFDSNKRLLLQKRALTKPTFPGVWTNTCCSHPLHVAEEMDGSPGVQRAATRKLAQELGYAGEHELDPYSLKYLKRYRYKARWDVEYGEHEIDYILIGRTDVDPPAINPDEVSEVKWADVETVKEMLQECRTSGVIEPEKQQFSPWFRMIADQALFDWWDHLDDLRLMRDHWHITNLNWHIGCGKAHFM